jgi:AcrR family transcriptional regulator
VATSRRDAILASALELFRRRSFHAVGIDEIGAAAGISGPAVYRHFKSKIAVLVTLFDSISERLLDSARKIGADGLSPEETLARLVTLQVSFAVEERSLLAVWIRERRSLPEEDGRRIGRRQVEYLGEWTSALGRLRPELSEAEVEIIVYAALGAINSAALRDSRLPRADLESLLRQLAQSVLGGPSH